MRQLFLRIVAGEVEPEEWEKWWNSNRLKPEENLTRGDRGRIMRNGWLDTQKRQNAIRETYEEVCRFMRYYHGLAQKTERS